MKRLNVRKPLKLKVFVLSGGLFFAGGGGGASHQCNGNACKLQLVHCQNFRNIPFILRKAEMETQPYSCQTPVGRIENVLEPMGY